MTIKFHLAANLEGECFNPMELEKEMEIKLYDVEIPGFFNPRLKRIITSGSASYGTEEWLSFDLFGEYLKKFSYDLKKISSNYSKRDTIEIDCVILGLIFEKGEEIKFQFKAEELSLLNSLGLIVAISCYRV